MTERLHFHFSLSCIGEGNGNPLQCSCLENPRDGEAWWAAICGVTQSRTRLKRLSRRGFCGSFLCPLHYWDLCGLPSAAWAHPLCCGACVHLSHFLRQALCVKGFVCTCFVSSKLDETSLSAVPRRLLALLKFARFPSLSNPGPHFVPQVCVLPGFVCHATLGHLGPPSVLQLLCVLARIVCLLILGSPRLPSGRGHSLRAVNRLRSSAFSVFCSLSPSFARFSETPQCPFGPASEGAFLCTRTSPV